MTLFRKILIFANVAATLVVVYASIVPMSDYTAPPRLAGRLSAGLEAPEQLDAPRPATTGSSFFRPVGPSSTVVPEAPPPNSSQVAHFRLVGLLKSDDSDVAIIQLRDRAIHRLKKDDTIDGWHVRTIERRSIILTKSGIDVALHLDPPASAIVGK